MTREEMATIREQAELERNLALNYSNNSPTEIMALCEALGTALDENERLRKALEHSRDCGICKRDVLCWDGHLLYVDAGLYECRNRQTCYIHSREAQKARAES